MRSTTRLSGGTGSSPTAPMSKAGRSVRAISSTRIWRQSGSINEVAGDSTVRSHRPTGPAFGRPEDRLHPVPISVIALPHRDHLDAVPAPQPHETQTSG